MLGDVTNQNQCPHFLINQQLIVHEYWQSAAILGNNSKENNTLDDLLATIKQQLPVAFSHFLANISIW